MEIEIFSDKLKAIIDPLGAWLTNLSDENGDILYPKRKVAAPDGTVKTRGGCHVCLPNFGPGGESGLEQHGFGRTSVWEIGEQTENRVTLLLKGGAEGYESLESQLTYALLDASLTITLQVKNTGKTSLRIAPGFHPYFILLPDEGQVKIDDVKYDLSDFADTLFEDGVGKKLITTKRTINLASENLSKWAIWTDQLANYVCVEPTVGGYMFLNEQPSKTELLQPNETKVYSLSISY